MTQPIHLGRGDGSPSARIMIVGEAWGHTEENTGVPFSGSSGALLSELLHEAGIGRTECYLTNLVNARPPQNDIGRWLPEKKKDYTSDMVQLHGRVVHPAIRQGYYALLREIDLVQPNVIVALGSSALWALTGATGVMKWRGSQLMTRIPPADWPADLVTPEKRFRDFKLIPTIHPAALLRDLSNRPVVVQDLKRVANEVSTLEYSNVPDWKFTVRPNFATAEGTLLELLARLDGFESSTSSDVLWLDFDLETRAGHIACAGLSWSLTEAICIPFMCVEAREGYWLPAEEARLVYLLWKVLTHPRVAVRGQNLLYDCQYTYRHWHFIPRVRQDTMITHHSAFCGLPKSLAFQASMHCKHYVYWKDDGKTWDKDVGEDQLWRYNCIDCVRTREVGEGGTATIEKLGLEDVEAFQQRMFWPVLNCMIRGVRIDTKLQKRLADQLMERMAECESWFARVLGHPLNPRSSLQMTKLFYEDLRQPPQYTRAKKGVPGHLTCDDEALRAIGGREPLLLPLIRKIGEYRSLGVFLSTFVMAKLDLDGRMRTSYNICGTETFRLASSENAFGSGGNLQNIPSGGFDEAGGFALPNVREMYLPDPGYEMFDKDLSKADLRVVTWEADEPEMKAMLREGKDPYVEIAREFYRDPTIQKKNSDGSENPKYRTFKSFAHGTHYLGSAYGLAARLGLSVHEAERAQHWYLGRMKRIKAWQEDFKRQIASRRYAQNIFGYRRYYFGRIDDATFREAIAWVPQSTVALVINKIWERIDSTLPHIHVLLQVHDSLVGQFPAHRRAECLAQLDAVSEVVLPYDDPLVIPSGTKTSVVSWGACK